MSEFDEEETVVLTVEQAVSILPDGDKVHTFLGFIGADWSRPTLLAAIATSKMLTYTGDTATGMGHGLAIENKDRWLFVATDPERLAKLKEETGE